MSLFFEKLSDDDLTLSSVADPMQELSRSISNTRDQITTNTTATKIISAYSDLLLHVAIVKCETQFAPLPVATEVQQQIDVLYLPAIEWQILIGKDRNFPWCKTPLDCVVKRREQLSAFLDANPIDLKFASSEGEFDARNMMKQLPQNPKPPSFLDGLIPQRIPILEYELLLSRFRQIERAVSAHKAERKETASKLLDTAKAQTKDAVSLVKNLTGNFSSFSDERVDTDIAINRNPEMVQKTTDALATTKRASALDPDLAVECKTLENELAANMTAAKISRLLPRRK